MYSDKAPYLVVVIFAAIGWTVNHLVNRVVESPTIEYSITRAVSNSLNKKMLIRINNITKTKMFENIKFEVVSNNTTGFNVTKAYIISKGISNQGNIAPDYKSTESVVFTIEQFQPNELFDLVVEFKGNAYPIFKLGNFSASDDQAKTVRLVDASLETWLVKNEIVIYVMVLIIAVTLIIQIYFNIHSTETNGS